MKPGDRVRVVYVLKSEREPHSNWQWFLGQVGVIKRRSRTEGAWIIALDARPEDPDLFFENELEVI